MKNIFILIKKCSLICVLVLNFAAVFAQSTTYTPYMIYCGQSVANARINLEAGSYKMYAKVWIDSDASLLGFRTSIGTDLINLNWDFKNQTKGSWVTLSRVFTISEAISNQVFKIKIMEDEYAGIGTGFFNLDNLYIEKVSYLQTKNFTREDVSIYPNPTSDLVTIACPEGSQVSFYNSLGILISSFKSNSNNNQISVANFPVGIYFVKINFNDKEVTKKLIVK